MKQIRKTVPVAILAGILLPSLMLNVASLMRQPPGSVESTLSAGEDTEAPDITVMIRMGNEIRIMDLEKYLVGVVLGEMPASFEPEALKAQAVVARTYTLRRRETGTKHTDADICTEPSCCQAYRDPSTYEESADALEKVAAAVRDTRGQVLTYQGNLIEATYFSSSGGRTEDAMAVWGNDLPYLQAVDSPEEGYEDKFTDAVSFSANSFCTALGVVLDGGCESWFGSVRYTNGGGVETMEIGGREYTGTMLRQLLGLRSTAFTVDVEKDVITFNTVGYGHRVGMSQYGAEAMAVDGKTYDQILAHYYVGTQLEEFIDTGTEFG